MPQLIAFDCLGPRLDTDAHDESLDRLLCLQSITAALCHAATSEQVADVILSEGLPALQATAGGVALLTEDRMGLVTLRSVGYPEEVAKRWQRFPADAPGGLATVVRRGKTLIRERLPSPRHTRLGGLGAFVALPLLAQGQPLGGLFLGFATEQTFAEQDIAFMQTLASLCGQALDRARLFDAERAARQRHQRDTLLLASVRDSVIVTDLEDIVTYWNEGATRLFGWTAEEMLGRPLTNRVPEHARPAMAAAARAIRDGGEFEGEWLDYRKDGSQVWIHARVCRFTDEAGQPLGLIGLAHDITSWKEREEDDRRKDELLAKLGHELRNAVQLLQLKGPPEPGLQHARSIIDRQVEHLTRLVDDLLDISRVASGRPTCRVLVVEDNRDAADSLSMLLKLWGHQAWVAYDGPSALPLAEAHRPDVVLLDLGLPRMDGFEVARRLRDEVGLTNATFMAVTGYGQESDRELTMEAGFCQHLLKPVDPAMLKALLDSLCRTA
jgi:PAS domain S-box-containing protein